MYGTAVKKISGTHFWSMLSRPQDHSAAGRLCLRKIWLGKRNTSIIYYFLPHPYPTGFCNYYNVRFVEYRGADKSLARPGRKQAKATEDFDVHISYL